MNTASTLSSFTSSSREAISLRTSAGGSQPGATVGNQVADGHHLHVRMILESKISAKLANAIPNDADPNFAVGNRLPTFRSMRIHRRSFKPLDGRLGCGSVETRSGRTDAKCVQKRTARLTFTSRNFRNWPGTGRVLRGGIHGASMEQEMAASSLNRTSIIPPPCPIQHFPHRFQHLHLVRQTIHLRFYVDVWNSFVG